MNQKNSRGSALGLLLSLAILLFGFAHFGFWVYLRATNTVQQAVPLVPFFGSPSIWNKWGPILVHLLEALAIIAAGSLLMMRARIALWGLLLGGWGTTLVLIARHWPSDDIQTRVRMFINGQKHKGLLPEDATIWTLIPDGVVESIVAVSVVWLIVLLANTLYALKLRSSA